MTIRIYTHNAVDPAAQFGVTKRFSLYPLTDDNTAWTDGGYNDYTLPDGFETIANFGGAHDLFVDTNNTQEQEVFEVVNHHGAPALQSNHRTIKLDK